MKHPGRHPVTGMALPNVNPDQGAGATTGGTPIDPFYALGGRWNWRAAQAIVESATGIRLIPYDAVYRTRTLGTTTVNVNRFTPANDLVLMPPPEVMQDISDLGFGMTLTSPHPAGNWTSGFYEWEKDHGQDPWHIDRGTGIKCFPIFPHLEYTYSMVIY